MPTNLTDRYNEIAAVAAATQVAEILTALAMEPSGKRYTKSRAQARERWMQLSQLATARANAAFGATKAEKKPRTAKPAPATAGEPKLTTVLPTAVATANE